MFTQDSIQLELSPGAQCAMWPMDGLCMKNTPIYILIIYGFLLCLGVCEWGGGCRGRIEVWHTDVYLQHKRYNEYGGGIQGGQHWLPTCTGVRVGPA